MSHPRRAQPKPASQQPLQTTPEEQQLQLLKEASHAIANHAFHMKRCLDGGSMMDALKHASAMISELRTPVLSPRNYFDIFMRVTDQLRFLESYIYDEHTRARPIEELYELVQHAGNILPRLYLLVTVGSAYIRSRKVPAAHVLRDLVEMCRGVQHPTRGLFLRSYLSSICKDKLPDRGNEYETDGDTTRDSVEFVMANFVEMNKLWVRMQYSGGVKLADVREAERQQLKTLVGTNLTRLGQLDGVDSDLYAEEVLPMVSEQILNCHDHTAQQYLLDVVIMAFPDEFHLRTLEKLLGLLQKIEPQVDVRAIVSALLKRFVSFSRETQDILTDQVFSMLQKHVSALITNRNMRLCDALGLQTCLLELAVALHPESKEFWDTVLEASAEHVSSAVGDQKLTDSEDIAQLFELISSPLGLLPQVTDVLSLRNFGVLSHALNYDNRVRICREVILRVFETNEALDTTQKVVQLFGFLTPLLVDEADTPRYEQMDHDDFSHQQSLISRLVHLIHPADLKSRYHIYESLRKLFNRGGEHRARYSLVPLMIESLRLPPAIAAISDEAEQQEITVRKAFQLCHNVLANLAPLSPSAALPLYLMAAQVAAQLGDSEICYQFISQAFTLYEDEFGSDSKLQFEAFCELVGSLYSLTGLAGEEYETLVLKATKLSARLLTKRDQCRAVCACSHLFWHPTADAALELPCDSNKVLQCLKKALTIADSLLDTHEKLGLFVAILDRCVFFFAQHAEHVSASFINKLIALVHVDMSSEVPIEVRRNFANILENIEAQKSQDDNYRAIDTQSSGASAAAGTDEDPFGAS